MKMTTRLGFLCLSMTLAACGGSDDSAEINGNNSNNENNFYSAENNYNNANNVNNVNNLNNANNVFDGDIDGVDENYQDGENYGELIENDFIMTADEATSTFSIDVDNASYTLMRRDINNGKLPVADGVRVEEYINFFDYDYAPPIQDQPFSINLEVAPSKFGQDLHLLRVGLKGKDVPLIDMKATNLVFLVDVSGSMQSSAKLPLVKESIKEAISTLRPDDRVAIVTYAGADRVALQSTPVSNSSAIINAVDNLTSAGGTNADAGIVRAYDIAEQNFIDGGNNRVMIMTDGDFNVGRTGQALVDLIIENREKEISLTCLGYGLGNYNDHIMESLARDGNGNYFYIDSIEEAQRIFGENLPSTLEVIAADVKIQIEFQSDTVVRYRLVGYENRLLNNEDFEDDTKDAGEIGPSHTVTALYEIEVDEQSMSETGMLAEVRIRHKSQYGEASSEYTQGIKLTQVHPTFEDASGDFQFAAAVAEFAEILRSSKHTDGMGISDVQAIATANSSSDQPKRMEFLGLLDAAINLLSN